MKTTIALAALVTVAASAAIAPSLHTTNIAERKIHIPEDNEPTVDKTSTRGQWVTSYSNKPGVENGPTVDKTSTRGQWVTSYSNDREPSVDETSTRGKWVSSYRSKGEVGEEPTVDETSTRGKWVTSYSNKKWSAVKDVDHWLPTGPAYLDMNALEEGYKAHMMIMHDSSSWLHSGFAKVKRFLGGEAE